MIGGLILGRSYARREREDARPSELGDRPIRGKAELDGRGRPREPDGMARYELTVRNYA